GRAEAAARFHLMADRIGDLAVFGDRDTVFGDLDEEMEALPEAYRSHGSPSELDVPLFVFNATGAPAAVYFEHNFDLARWLYACALTDAPRFRVAGKYNTVDLAPAILSNQEPDVMQSPPISQAEIDARIHGHIDELLELWWAEQGASKTNDLELIASA